MSPSGWIDADAIAVELASGRVERQDGRVRIVATAFEPDVLAALGELDVSS